MVVPSIERWWWGGEEGERIELSYSPPLPLCPGSPVPSTLLHPPCASFYTGRDGVRGTAVVVVALFSSPFSPAAFFNFWSIDSSCGVLSMFSVWIGVRLRRRPAGIVLIGRIALGSNFAVVVSLAWGIAEASGQESRSNAGLNGS